MHIFLRISVLKLKSFLTALKINIYPLERVRTTHRYPMSISIDSAEHYIWGEKCDGWHLVKREDMSVIQERVPAGSAEVMHYHERARQFFYILEGAGTMAFEDHEVVLQKGQGLEIVPMIKHQFKN